MRDIAVSVIIPVYKTEKYLKDCLTSLFAHTDAPDFEVIVVDDASPDNSVEIARQFSGVKILQHDVNKGLSEARNTGIRAAHGKYLYFVDSDDKLAKNALIRLWKHVEAHPGVDIVYGQTLTMPTDKVLDTYLSLTRVGIKEFDDNQLKIRRVHSVIGEIAQNKLIRHEWLLENNLFFTPGLLHEDLEWHLRAYGRVGSYAAETGGATYFYLQRADSITGKQEKERKNSIIIDILANIVPKIADLDAPILDRIGRLLISHGRLLKKEDKTKMNRTIEALCARPEISSRNRAIINFIRYYPKRLHPALLTKWLR